MTTPQTLFGQLLQQERTLEDLDEHVRLRRAGHPLSEAEERDRAQIRAELGQVLGRARR